PAITRFTADLAKQASEKKALFPDLACSYEKELILRLSTLTDCITEKTDDLEEAVIALQDADDVITESALICDTVLPKMSELRIPCDQAELLTAKSYWPFPTYGDILFSVK
ncbi:MAG: glutamine synthetase type III, partial [Firmicutes bacterium]|nr:glutamine synthetase type III [Bacillota bacterium]